MKKIGFAAAALVSFLFAAGVGAHAAESPLEVAVVSAAVATEKPVIARAVASDIDGDDYAVDELLKIAMTEDEGLRIAAVEVLGEMGSTRARAVLGVVLYANRMPSVRAAAADQLGNLGDGESVYALALALETERDSEVRDVIDANLERNLRLEPAPEELPGTPIVVMADAG